VVGDGDVASVVLDRAEFFRVLSALLICRVVEVFVV
jgi:hypothetical protein